MAVADTGLDFTHSELAEPHRRPGRPHRQDAVHRLLRRPADADFADTVRRAGQHRLERPRLVDRRQHRRRARRASASTASPRRSTSFDLKISEWCGSAYDSSILDAFLYAADHGIDVVTHLVRRLPGPQRSGPGSHLPGVRRRGRSTPRARARSSSPLPATSTCASAPAARSSATVRSPCDPGSDPLHRLLRALRDPRWHPGRGRRRPPPATSSYASSATCAPGTTGDPTTSPRASRRRDAHQPTGVGLTEPARPTTRTTVRASTSPAQVAPASSTSRSADRGGTPRLPVHRRRRHTRRSRTFSRSRRTGRSRSRASTNVGVAVLPG